MRILSKLAVATLATVGASVTAFADVGVLDKYECHKNQETKKYHCHGPVELAKLGGVIVGADTRIQGWSGADNGLFLFAGVAANIEVNYKWIAATGSYFMMPQVTNADPENINFDDSIYLQGWEAGLKFGPGVGRLGSKMYLTAGWSNPVVTDAGDASNNANIAGYYAGAGFGANTQTLVFDVIATYRDATAVAEFLTDQGQSPDVLSFDTRVAIGWRF
jgi:hypothetical protein